MVWQYSRRTRLYNKRNKRTKRELLRIKSRRVWQQVSLGVLLLTFIWGGIAAFWPKTTATPSASATNGVVATQDFAYTGDVQTFTAPADGNYKLEVWGAQGGNGDAGSDNPSNGGNGGYSVGIITMTVNQTIYVYVGGQGATALIEPGATTATTATAAGGWNGGGNGFVGSNTNYAMRVGSGGGGTDIRTVPNTTYDNRVIVAGGGGGGATFRAGTGQGVNLLGTLKGAAGGGINGIDGNSVNSKGAIHLGDSGSGGTQIAGGANAIAGSGSFGEGGDGYGVTSSCGIGGGGGGYFGGGGGSCVFAGMPGNGGGGGGGSGYIGGGDLSGSMTAAQTIDGTQSMPAPGGGTETGHAGDGYARITQLSPPPTITSITPSNGPTDGGTTVAITGSGFGHQDVIFKQVVVGGSSVCAIASDDNIYCWNTNEDASDFNKPALVPKGDIPNNATPRLLSVTTNKACVAMSDNEVYCWGLTTQNTSAPSALDMSNVPGGNIKQIVGGQNGCLIASNDQIYCWVNNGAPASVQQGDAPNGVMFKAIAYQSLFLLSDVVMAVGNDNNIYTISLYSVFENITPPTFAIFDRGDIPNNANVDQVSTGQLLGPRCFVANDNVYCAILSGSGMDVAGQLGTGNTSDPVPATITLIARGNIPNGPIQYVSTGLLNTCVIANDNKVYCWGILSYGGGTLSGSISGDGDITVTSPIALPQGDMPNGVFAKSVSVGDLYACVIASDDNTYCWGAPAGTLYSDEVWDYNLYPKALDMSALSSTHLASVTFDDQTCTDLTIISDTQATCVTPAHATGAVDVIAANSDGQTATLANGFTYADPCDGSECFAFTIDTRLTSTGATTGDSTTFAIPTSGRVNNANNPYNWVIDWGDGTPMQAVSGTSATDSNGVIHDYVTAGQYQIAIRPNGAATTGWLNAFGFYDNTSGANVNDNKYMFRSIDTPLTNLMRTKGATYRFAYMFQGARNALDIPDNLFASISTAGDTDFSSMFYNTFYYFAYNSTAATIPAGLFNSINTSSGTNFNSMFYQTFYYFAYNSTAATIPAGLFNSINTSSGTVFSNMFGSTFYNFAYNSTTATIPAGLFNSINTSQGTTFNQMFSGTFWDFAYNSTTATIPAGLFDKIDTSLGTNFQAMFSQTFTYFAYKSTTATIPPGLFDKIDTSLGTNFRAMFQSTFFDFAYNSTTATIPAGLFAKINTSQVTNPTSSNLSGIFNSTFGNFARRSANFVVNGLVVVVATSSNFQGPYSTKNTSTDNTPDTNPTVNPGDVVVPTYNSSTRSITKPTGTYANYNWYRTDGTSCEVANPTSSCGARDSTTLVSFPDTTEWTPDTSTEKGNVTFYGVPTLTETTYRIYQNANSLTPGAALAADNTPATIGGASATGRDFRIRTGFIGATAVGENYRLQFGALPAADGATCADIGSWTVVDTATAFSYNPNSSVTSGTAISSWTNNPAVGSGSWTYQQYISTPADFATRTAVTYSTYSSLWDFSLRNLSAADNTTYCFRIARADGSALDAYNYYPQVTTGSAQYLTLNAADNVSFASDPGTISYSSGGVSVSTNAANGYILQLNAANSALVNGGAAIPSLASSATAASPATFTAGTAAWGWHVNGVGNLGTISAAGSNLSSSTTKWAAMPTTPTTILTGATTDQSATGGSNTPSVTTIWYGVSTTANQASGAYSQQVIITAVANP